MNKLATDHHEGLTLQLAHRVVAVQFSALTPDIKRLVKQCLLDYIGVTLAGVHEPATQLIYAELAEQGGHEQAGVFGCTQKLPATSAALINGTAAHALDYDDVNISMPGHPSVAILPALLALGESLGCSGEALMAAFVAGYEVECAMGEAMSPGHYDVGFHSTATLGSLGAAAACSHLLGLNAEQTAQAIGIAGTQAAGLKSMFGTMCKPLHAGKASYHGLLSAKLAQRGFQGRTDFLECEQGFASNHGPDFNQDAALVLLQQPFGAHLRNNLFKYHAACYLTHSAIEAVCFLQQTYSLTAEAVDSVTLQLDQRCGGVCNILEPTTGLEAKFSLRLTAAMAFAGVDTGRMDSYTDAMTTDPQLVALRDKVQLDFKQGWPLTPTTVTMLLKDGQTRVREHDSGIALSNLNEQQQKLQTKFSGLLAPLLSSDRVNTLSNLIGQLDKLEDIRSLVELCTLKISA
jgi:2-methylcitrate dehydratase PrpD